MHASEQAVLAAFAQQPQAQLTTGELVRSAFPQEHDAIQQDLRSSDPETHRRGLRNKARLHRKLLYHLNKLVARNALRVAEVKEHGEKTYALAMERGEIVVSDKQMTVAIAKHPAAESFVADWQERGIVTQMTQAIHKVDAYAVRVDGGMGVHGLRAELLRLYTHIEDAVGIIGFERFLGQDSGTLAEGVAELIADTKDYGISVTLRIDIGKKALTGKDHSFFTAFALQHPSRVYIVFAGRHTDFQEQRSHLERIADVFSQNDIKLNLQDLGRDADPYLMGRAGMYSIDERQQEALARIGGVVVANASIVIDLGREQLTADALRTLAIDCARTLLARSSLQRRLAPTIFNGLTAVGSLREQLAWTRTYLRLWNYDTQRYPYPALLGTVSHELDVFARQETTIFAACGVPLNYRILLSSAFPHYGVLSVRMYDKKPVYDREGLRTQELELREQLAAHYSAERIRVFREGDFTGQDVISEMLWITRSHDLAFVTYDFRKMQKMISLTRFL